MSEFESAPPGSASFATNSRSPRRGGGARGDGAGAEARGAAGRLEVFQDAQVRKIADKVGVVLATPWPRLEGCLAILFSSRSGSTYLARELECIFDIGRLRESLNPAHVARGAAADVVAGRRDAWFSFKAGGTSVIAAELCGFFDAYLPTTSFLLLVRRDIVAQAVSRVKAKQTQRWHSNQTAQAHASYDAAKIAQSVSIIAEGVERLKRYAEASGRPWRGAVYEDFAQGDFRLAVAACDALGVPRRRAGDPLPPKPVERIGDGINEAWAARFRQDAAPAIRDRIERYLARVAELSP